VAKGAHLPHERRAHVQVEAQLNGQGKREGVGSRGRCAPLEGGRHVRKGVGATRGEVEAREKGAPLMRGRAHV
jgi:hypothetical protein